MINISAGKLYADDYFGQKFSTAGFYSLPNTGREVWNMNPAWRFYKGDISGAELPDFDDSSWEQVSLPHGIELLPTEASGCINYQGPVWYRKKMSPDKNLSGKRITLYFEGIMGKSELWVNGKYFARHLGGYLPWVIDITNVIKAGEINVIAVRADNSDDPSYPPGKPQRTLDFTYAGGIYRDCWLIAHNDVYITDANAAGIQAGGGLFVSYDTVSEKSATLRLDLGLHNSRTSSFRGKIRYELYAPNGKYVADIEQGVSIGKKGIKQSVSKLTVVNPLLWTPDSPYLYTLKVFVKDSKGRIIDGYATRIGIRTFEFKGKDGFWLNGKPYPEPLVGANRHQDFAVIGNALPNSLHWRDAKKLRDAGLKVIRSAHYPQDPAFMDACDELGLFVIVPTPGWQFWNNDPLFELRVYDDIRQMVRRDRNHPSVWLWEPILNETWYPEDFAKNTLDIIHSEYPFSPCYAACDASAKGHELFPVQYTHPSMGGGGVFNAEKLEPNVSYFTREWGDNVDDWFSHNSPSRVYRGWGEIPMLQQAQGYARPNFRYTCYDLFYTLPRQHVGGCLWHPFDHQRGYHPDPFYGGIMDAFRQPKLSYYMFCAQRPNQTNPDLPAETGPMVYIANSLTPFSPSDVTVYSNCEEVRLTSGIDGKQWIHHRPDTSGMPSPIITFPGVWDVMEDKRVSRSKEQEKSYLLAEGLIDGKVVARHQVMPSRRPSKLMLHIDSEGLSLRADGSDMVVLIASVCDENGNIKRLNNEEIIFSIDGPGRLVASEQSLTNPRAVSWGTAPVLVQAGTTPGIIKVRASVLWKGLETPSDAYIEIPVVESEVPWIADDEELQSEAEYWMKGRSPIEIPGTVSGGDKSKEGLDEVAKQQSDFE